MRLTTCIASFLFLNSSWKKYLFDKKGNHDIFSLCMHNFNRNVSNLRRCMNFEIFFLRILHAGGVPNNSEGSKVLETAHTKDTTWLFEQYDLNPSDREDIASKVSTHFSCKFFLDVLSCSKTLIKDIQYFFDYRKVIVL